MGLPAFDTHAYIKRLKLAGFSDEQAEAQSELQAEVLSSLVTDKLVTKDDLLRLETGLKQDIAALAAETKQEIAALATETKQEIAALAAETKQEFIRQNSKITKLDVKFTGKFNQLYWMLAFLLATNVTVLLKLFHA